MTATPFPAISPGTTGPGVNGLAIALRQQIHLDDGRPVSAKLWTESGQTYVSYTFSTKGLERCEKASLLQYLNSQGIKLNLHVAPEKSTVEKGTDIKDEPFWSVTLTIGESDESTIIQSQQIHLDDGRPVSAKLWIDSGCVYVSYYFSKQGIEQQSNEGLLDYLNSQGIKIDRQMAAGRSSVRNATDDRGEPLWCVTLTISKKDE